MARERVNIKNLEKTKELIGEDAYLRCKKCNISSRWTDIPNDAIEVYYPGEE